MTTLPVHFDRSKKHEFEKLEKAGHDESPPMPSGWWVPFGVIFAVAFWGSLLWWLFS